jgi:hypothetical protein
MMPIAKMKEGKVRSPARVGLILGLGFFLAAAGWLAGFRRPLFLCLWNSSYPAAAEEPSAPPAPGERDPFLARLAAAAIEQTTRPVSYDPSYLSIPYPGGDVPDDRGVCSDVLIRAFRKVGVDLQKEVHKDMLSHFRLYPPLWGLTRPDPNIDHRRVPNLMVFFKRKGEVLAITSNPADYAPGEIVAWDLGGGISHLGLAVDRRSADGKRYMVVHNIGAGPRLEDVLFAYPIIGHFRYYGPDPHLPALESELRLKLKAPGSN